MANDKIERVKKATAALEPWEAELANEAKDEKAREANGLPRISTKGGEFNIDSKRVGKSIKLAVVDYVAEKVYYDTPYDPNTPATPACYSFGLDEKTMVPHEASPRKQAEKCSGCPHNAFNTASIGKGKACKDYRKLLVMSPVLDSKGEPKVDADGVAKAEKRVLSVPPASLKGFGAYLSSLQDTTRTGNVREGIMEVEIESLRNGGHGLKFAFVKAVSKDALQAIMESRAQSKGLLTTAYPVLSEEEEAAPKNTRAGRKAR